VAFTFVNLLYTVFATLRVYISRAVAGGGRSSARETIGRVAAAAVARKLLHLYCGCEVCYRSMMIPVALLYSTHYTVHCNYMRWLQFIGSQYVLMVPYKGV
jgi:chorismate synthase